MTSRIELNYDDEFNKSEMCYTVWRHTKNKASFKAAVCV